MAGAVGTALAAGVALAVTLGLLLGLVAALVVLSAAELAPRVRRADWGGFWAWWRLQTRPPGKGADDPYVTAIRGVVRKWKLGRR